MHERLRYEGHGCCCCWSSQNWCDWGLAFLLKYQMSKNAFLAKNHSGMLHDPSHSMHPVADVMKHISVRFGVTGGWHFYCKMIFWKNAFFFPKSFRHVSWPHHSLHPLTRCFVIHLCQAWCGWGPYLPLENYISQKAIFVLKITQSCQITMLLCLIIWQ